MAIYQHIALKRHFGTQYSTLASMHIRDFLTEERIISNFYHSQIEAFE